MSEIKKVKDMLASDLRLISDRHIAWRNINRIRLQDEVAATLAERGVRPGRADASARADERAVRQVVKALADAYGWLSTLDNNLHEDKLID